MKKLVILVSVLAFVVSCTTIHPSLTGKRVVPADEYYDDYYTSYDPFYYPSPYISVGMGWWWNPFLYWGFAYGPCYYGYPYYYVSPYYWYSPWYGYYPGYYSGYYHGYGYPVYRYGRTSISKRELKGGSASATSTRRTISRGSSGRSTSSGRSSVSKSGSSGSGGSSGRTVSKGSSSGSKGSSSGGSKVKKN